MSILVVGSVALDTVETPNGKVVDSLGGSATYFSVAASFFPSTIRFVGAVGDDFPKEHIDFLKNRGINLDGLDQIRGGKTFRWGGSYIDDLNSAQTHFTELNVFGHFAPKLPNSYRDTPYVFLANINPELQLEVLKQVRKSKLVVCDTMNLWIDISKPALMETLKQVDILIINDSEAKQLTQESNLIRAGRQILTYGPSRVIIKKGEHGALSLTESEFFALPAYPLASVSDPTGAGDSFAGAFMGHLASTDQPDNEEAIRQAIGYGTIVASFNVGDFSLNRLRNLTIFEIEERYEQLRKMVNF